MQVEQLRETIQHELDELKAIDLVTLDVRELTSMTDYMIICSGRSSRHVKSMADKIVEVLKAKGVRPLSVEGTQNSEWVLVDFADIIVHIMQTETREFYQLEKLWRPLDAKSETASEADSEAKSDV